MKDSNCDHLRDQKYQHSFFEPLKAHICEPNISLIRLMLNIQNPDYGNTLEQNPKQRNHLMSSVGCNSIDQLTLICQTTL